MTESSAAPRINPDLRFNYGRLAKQKRDGAVSRVEGGLGSVSRAWLYVFSICVCVHEADLDYEEPITWRHVWARLRP